MEILQNEPRLVSGQEIHKILLGNAAIFQEVDVTWQFLKLSCSVRGELMWSPSTMKFFKPEFLVMISETCLFRDPEMSVSYFA
jgi:hypothetical protein